MEIIIFLYLIGKQKVCFFLKAKLWGEWNLGIQIKKVGELEKIVKVNRRKFFFFLFVC
jgi:hypothetical protein